VTEDPEHLEQEPESRFVPEPDDVPEPEDLDREQPAGWLWLAYLFFAPRIFFRHFVAPPANILTVLAAWIWGMSGAIDRIAMRTATSPESVYIVTRQWSSYWIAMLILGAIAGVLHYVIGGWWYRVRLVWSGAQDVDHALARRMYLFSAQIIALPVLLMTLTESVRFANPVEAFHAETGREMAVLGLMGIALPCWSSWISFAGANALLTLRRGRALFWLLILPCAFYALVAGLLIVMLAEVWTLKPAIDRPKTLESPLLTFKYPANWRLTESIRDDLAEAFLDTDTGSFMRLTVYRTTRSIEEELQVTLTRYTEDADDFRQTGTLFSWGKYSGEGRTFTVLYEGTPYTLRIFIHPLNDLVYFETQELFYVGEQRTLAPGYELIRQTARADDAGPLAPPDIAHPLLFKGENLRFSLPANWNAEAGDESLDPDIGITVTCAHDARAFFYIYTTDNTPAEELEATLANYKTDLLSPTEDCRFEPWPGFQGASCVTHFQDAGVPYRLRAWVTPLSEGRCLEGIFIYPPQGETMLTPGFDLILSTLIADGLIHGDH
jgi:hypothetical protein